MRTAIHENRQMSCTILTGANAPMPKEVAVVSVVTSIAERARRYAHAKRKLISCATAGWCLDRSHASLITKISSVPMPAMMKNESGWNNVMALFIAMYQMKDTAGSVKKTCKNP